MRPPGGCTASACPWSTRFPIGWRWRLRATARLYRQVFRVAFRKGPVEVVGETMNRRGTTVRFHPDAEIFGIERSASSRPAS
jgi:hypothetical protein